MGWTSACFHCWETLPAVREPLNNNFKAGASSLATARFTTPSYVENRTLCVVVIVAAAVVVVVVVVIVVVAVVVVVVIKYSRHKSQNNF